MTQSRDHLAQARKARQEMQELRFASGRFCAQICRPQYPFASRTGPNRGKFSGVSFAMRHYSVFAIVKEALGYHQGWERAWRNPTPKAQYDAIIIGAGGHGLATAYYLDHHFVEEPFKKRKRDRLNVDQVDEGIGDPRVSQGSDVYLSPASLRKRKKH